MSSSTVTCHKRLPSWQLNFSIQTRAEMIQEVNEWYTLSLHVYAQFWTAHNPCLDQMSFLNLITQRKTSLATFILISLETLCTYMHEDTVTLHVYAWGYSNSYLNMVSMVQFFPQYIFRGDADEYECYCHSCHHHHRPYVEEYSNWIKTAK